MSDPTNLPNRTTPHWSLYQRDIFVGGTKTGGGQLPTFSTGAYPTHLQSPNLVLKVRST